MLIDADTTLSSAQIVPSTLTLKSTNGALIIKSATGAINFQGIGLVDPESPTARFSGFSPGDITFTGTVFPQRISTEIFDTGNASLNDRVALLDAAFIGKRVTFVLSPRTMDKAGTVVSQFHQLEFLEGSYPNTKNVTTPVFYMSNNARAYGTHNSWLYEPDEYGENVGIFGVSDLDAAYEDIKVENLQFRGGAGVHGNAGSTIILGNVHRGGIYNCRFWKTYGYNILGGYGNTGNYAEDSDFIDNEFFGVGSQALAVINAKSVWVLNNFADQKDATGNATYTVFDFEGNTDTDKMEDIFCMGNEIDCRDITPASQVFAPSAVTVLSDIINIPGHGLAQGKNYVLTTTGVLPAPLAINTVYYAIPVDANNLKVAATPSDAARSIAINLTTQGTGNHTIDPLERYVVGILVQARSNSPAKNVTVAHNKVYSGSITAGVTDQMLAGIGMDGVHEGYFHNNTVRGGIQAPISISLSRNIKAYDNSVTQGGTVSGEAQTMNLRGNADSDFYNNNLSKTSNPTGIQAAGIFESEEDYIVTTSGAIITRISGGPLFYEHFIGLKVTINNTDYTISAFTDKGVMTASASIGTLTRPTFTSASVNAGTDEITLTGHNFITGAKLEFSTDGVLPAHTEPPFVIATGYRRYFAIVINANTIKIANSLANALAGTAIDLTNGGTGNHRLSPVMSTKFSNNKYRDNATPDGHRLEPTGTSQIISTADDGFIAPGVTDADYTVSKNAGIVVFPVLTASRTATLPDSTTLNGKTIVFKDGGGTAATFNIVVDGNGSQTIDGAATKSIISNYGSFTIRSIGTGWISVQSGDAGRLKGTVTINPASIAATTISTQTFTLTGAVVNDSLVLNPPALTTGMLVLQSFVSAANQITITFQNTTGGAIDEASATWVYALSR